MGRATCTVGSTFTTSTCCASQPGTMASKQTRGRDGIGGAGEAHAPKHLPRGSCACGNAPSAGALLSLGCINAGWRNMEGDPGWSTSVPCLRPSSCSKNRWTGLLNRKRGRLRGVARASTAPTGNENQGGICGMLSAGTTCFAQARTRTPSIFVSKRNAPKLASWPKSATAPWHGADCGMRVRDAPTHALMTVKKEKKHNGRPAWITSQLRQGGDER